MATINDAAVRGLRPNRRYICTHDSSGKSVYAAAPAQLFHAVPGVGGMAHSYSVGAVPAVLAGEADVAAYRAEEGPSSHRSGHIVHPDGGANLLVIDLAPGAESAMHRTVSVDFSICVQGEIEHELDGGERVRLFPGDHIVQRGTNHRWSNPSQTQPARFVAVTLPCVPFEIAGKVLEEVHVPSAEWDRQNAKM